MSAALTGCPSPSQTCSRNVDGSIHFTTTTSPAATGIAPRTSVGQMDGEVHRLTPTAGMAADPCPTAAWIARRRLLAT